MNDGWDPVKKTLILFLCALTCSSHVVADREAGIGEEYITPLSYPKFSILGDYDMARNFYGFADPSLRYKLGGQHFGAGMSFEAGLCQYFNAGAFFSIDSAHLDPEGEPILMRFALFGKPYLPLGDRFGIFARVSGGIASSLMMSGDMKAYLRYIQPDALADLARVYKGQPYTSGHYGGMGSATIGIEYFPFSRMGVALEWGIRASIYRTSRNMLFLGKVNDVPGAPNAFNFMIYEMPLSLTLQAIL